MGNRCNCPQCDPGDRLCPAAEDAERDVVPTEVEYWKPLAMERLHAALQAIDERNEARRELDSYKDGHLCHPRNSLNSDSGGICAHCGRTLLEQPGYEDALTKARADVERLKAERAADITPAQAYELRDILRTLTASGTALLTSARELVRLKEQAEAELNRRYPRETEEPTNG